MKTLKSSFFLIAIASIAFACSSTSKLETTIPIDKFEKSIAKDNVQLLDVRTEEEYRTGHLPNAFLADWKNQEEFKRRVQALDKSKPVYTYCLSGVRSGEATQWLRENGFTAYNLSGGIMAWKNAGKPIEELEAVRQIPLREYMAMIPKYGTVLVNIGAAWCPPCKKMNPVIDSLINANSSVVSLMKIDGGQQTNLIKELKIEAIPTFIIYKEGKETWRNHGIIPAAEIAAHF